MMILDTTARKTQIVVLSASDSEAAPLERKLEKMIASQGDDKSLRL